MTLITRSRDLRFAQVRTIHTSPPVCRFDCIWLD